MHFYSFRISTALLLLSFYHQDCYAIRRPTPLAQELGLAWRGGSQEDGNAGEAEAHFQEITAIKNMNHSPGIIQENASGAASSFLSRRSAWLVHPLKQNSESLKQNVAKATEKFVTSTKVGKGVARGIEFTQTNYSKLLSSLAPALVAVFCQEPLSFHRMYALALVGSSVGFYMFLYFISIGYALGVSLPVVVGLCLVRPNVASYTFWHSALVGIWGLRLVIFLIWREYVNWPALHRKIVQVNRMQAPTLVEKLIGWLVYSFLYVCMLSPCWFRLSSSLKEDFIPISAFSKITLSLQLVGLTLETVADWQKSHFKASFNEVDNSPNRYEWCNQGLYSFSTFPNYLGEWIFWVGTFLGGLSDSMLQTFFSLAGLIFISWVLHGAVKSLAERQAEKYSGNKKFDRFAATHGVCGPTKWRPRKNSLLQSEKIPPIPSPPAKLDEE